ncbi:molybdopterin-binding protein [Pseudonocardiaceae bacterium YIM PH 21723]|nr:molybdopterin-binding protein [Pseudonocardiaceae bacterium YIM PH 21723]
MKLLDRLPRADQFRSPVHTPGVSARIGMWLGIAFGLCFATGLLSHGIQHGPDWFTWPSRPISLYRITQGVHVISGVAAIPLLLAKLWSVYPKLFERPAVRSIPHALERGSILVLIGGAFFELVTGLFNVAQNYPWRFYFPAAHYAVAWITAGSLLLHIAVKLPIIREALGEKAPSDSGRSALGRRHFLLGTGIAVGAAVLATAGSTVPWLRRVSVLSWRSAGPALPVNRTAKAAAIEVPAGWQLTVRGRDRTVRLSLAQLAALPQTTAELPIACVEGWSQSATWTGVQIRQLISLVGASDTASVRIESLEKSGLYRASVLPAEHVGDPLTLLALRLDGEPLSPDHGYPCRIIAPSRPGVLQTKWVSTVEVRG